MSGRYVERDQFFEVPAPVGEYVPAPPAKPHRQRIPPDRMLTLGQVAAVLSVKPARLRRRLRRGWYRSWGPKRVRGRWLVSRKRFIRWRRRWAATARHLQSLLKHVYGEPLRANLMQESELMDLFKPEKRYPEAFGL